MRRQLLAGIIVLLLLGWVGPRAEGEQEKSPLELTGERLLYHATTEEVVAEKGKVKYEDVLVEADLIKIFLNTSILEAEGNVHFEREEEGYTADWLRYNWEEEQWQFRSLRSDLTGPSIVGKIFFKGARGEGEEEMTEVEEASLTSCDLEDPHYHVEAEKIVIYPGEKIILHGLSYHDFGVKLFSIPYYVVFLNRKEQLPFIPVFGHSSSAGYYLNLFYNYYIDDSSYGTVYLDWWQKQGWGLGVRHYLDQEDQTGEVYLYYRDTGTGSPSLKGSLEYYREWDDSTSLDFNLDYSDKMGEKDETYSGWLSLYREEEKWWSRLNLDYDFDSGDREDQLTANLRYHYDFGDSLVGDLTLRYYQLSDWGNFFDQDLTYLFSLKKSSSDYTYYLRYEGHEDLEGDEYTADRPREVLMIPEIEVRGPTEQIGDSDFSYQTNLLLGRYREEETGVEESRLRFTIDTKGEYSISDQLSLEPRLSFQQDFYGNGFARYVWSGSLRLEEEFSDSFSLAASYQRAGYDGATPFRFDYTTRETDYLGLSLNFEESPWEVSLSGNYDFERDRAGEAVLRVDYQPDDDNQVSLRGGYNFSQKKWSRLVFEISWELSPEWKIDLDGRYDLEGGELDDLIVGLTRDLHCREVSLFYNQSRETFWLEYGIKAFPSEKFTLGGD